MAGSASTITYDDGKYDGGQGYVQRVVIAWTSDDSTGAVTATTKKISGRLLKVVTVPSATAAPTANYDIAITDEQSVDVLAGLAGTGGTDKSLLNRHTSNTETVHLAPENSLTDPVPGLEPKVCGKLAVAVTNAGNSKAGTIIIYWTPG